MINRTNVRETKRVARHERIRKVVIGTPQRPRLYLHRSLNNLYAQVIDDTQGKVLFGVSTLSKDVKSKITSGGNVAAAKILGEALGIQAKSKGITKVCFDRAGYRYHGRVKAFADSAREKGLEF
jgi:large subunit ribosomal protein L18